VRLFVAINLPADVRSEIAGATAPLRAAAPSVAWTEADRLHLTLKFIGEQPREAADALANALRRAAARHSSLTLDLGGLGAFPSRRQPRIVWLGVAPDPKLELLHHDVESACEALGYELEGRAFRPHLTLGRVRTGRGSRGAVDAAAATALASAAREVHSRWSVGVDAVDLMESQLAPGGPRYAVVARAQLGAP